MFVEHNSPAERSESDSSLSEESDESDEETLLSASGSHPSNVTTKHASRADHAGKQKDGLTTATPEVWWWFFSLLSGHFCPWMGRSFDKRLCLSCGE